MTNPTPRKISELATLSSIAIGDFIPIVDVSDTSFNATGETKKITYDTLKTDIKNSIDSGYTETDPIFSASVAASITSNNIGQWDAAYGWGNHAVQGYLQSIASLSINALDDVDTPAPSTGEVLKWNGSAWVASGDSINLDDISNVNLSSVADGEILKYDASTSSWINATESGGTTINGLNDVGDVNITSVVTGQVLKYNGTAWINQTDAGGIGLSDLSVTTASAGTASLSYNNTSGVFTYTPPDLSSIIAEVVDDTTPQLGGNLDLNSKNITGTGDINIDGDLKGDTIRLSNTATIPSSGNRREIKVIGQAPYFYDGTDWRPFFLINSPTQIPADTNWGDVMIRSTFDLNINDVKYNATPTKSSPTSNVQIVSSPTKIGNSALSLNGAYLEYDVSNNGPGNPYNFNGVFTMEAWVYFNNNIPTNTGAPMGIFVGGGSDTSRQWALTVYKDGSNLKFSWFNPNNPNHASVPGTLMASENSVTQEWHHIALVKEQASGDIELYWDGSRTNHTTIIDNNILNPDKFRLGGGNQFGVVSIDALFDDLRISEREQYSSNFDVPTTQLPVSGSTTQIIPPRADKKGEITLGSTPTFKGSSGLTVTQQSSGVYRLTFASAYSSSTDYYVMAQGMDHSSNVSSYITISRATGYVDITVKNQANNNAVNTGYLGVQIINHV